MAEDPGARLRIALELHELGQRMMRLNLRRRRPAASDADIDAALTAWLQHRPGAEDGDAVGTRSPRFG